MPVVGEIMSQGPSETVNNDDDYIEERRRGEKEKVREKEREKKCLY